jgi:ubiquinone/menaquinone biosynthesis C-methylase UbiE
MRSPLRVYRFVTNLPATIAELRNDMRATHRESEATTQHLANRLDEAEKKISSSIDLLVQKQSELIHQLSLMNSSDAPVSKGVRPKSSLQADNHALDGYYKAFEEKFRGSEDEIYVRLRTSYKKLLTGLPGKIKKLKVVDIGCGRGELLRLYKEVGIKSLGIDLNQSMVERCVNLGFDAIQENAITHLKNLPANSLAGISGIHFVEHITFEDLYTLLNECFRVLAPGGFILFETPNPENLVVGASTFWYDSSHLKPIPPDVLAFIVEYIGFQRIELLRLHPAIKTLPETDSLELKEVFSRVFGSRDYAVYARKSSE